MSIVRYRKGELPPITEERVLRELANRPDSEIDYSDVLDWLRSKGKGYQTRMNQILREAMLRERANQP